MAYTRQTHTKLCPRTGKCGCHWASTVRFGPGPRDRITETDASKTVISKWAADREAEIRRGDFVDPRRAEITLGAWREQCQGSRHQERASRKRDESHWRVHVGPRWANVQIGRITKTDVSTWVVDMETSHKDTCRNPKACPGCRVGAATVEGAVGVLRGLLELAVDAERLRVNPARKIAMAPRNAHVDRVLDPDEERDIIARATKLFGDRVDATLFIELCFETGMRWEELAALPPEMIDTKRRRIHIAWVMERDGTARPYAKSDAGNRMVGYGDHLAGRLRAAKTEAPVVDGVFPDKGPCQLVFYSPGGGGRAKRKAGEPGVLRYPNWRRYVWLRVLQHEVPDRSVKEAPAGRSGPKRRPVRLVSYLVDPQPTFHDVRHTVFTRLAEEGVPIHDIMALAGHADIRTAQRYLHSREERFDRVREALEKARQRSVGDSGDEEDG